MHRPSIRGLWICSGLLALAGAVGCGPGYKLVSVSGRVTLDGDPLPDAMVLTQPIGSDENPTPGPGSFARTDADGRYTLELQSEDRPGAVPGEHTVKIKELGETRESSDDSVSREEMRQSVPPEYLEGKVKITIPDEGTDALDFELESPRRRRR